MRIFIPAIVIGAALAIAQPLRSSVDLVSRQTSGNFTFPQECEADCVGFAKFASGCPDTKLDLTSVSYECVCKTQFFEDALRCGACAPDVFANQSSLPGLEGYIQIGLQKCHENGFPVTVANATSGTPQATSSGAANGTSTRASNIGTTAAPSSSSPASAQTTGAASQLHVASGLLAMAFSAGLYVLL